MKSAPITDRLVLGRRKQSFKGDTLVHLNSEQQRHL